MLDRFRKKKAQPQPLFLMTGTYVDAFHSFGLELMLEPVVLGSGFQQIVMDIPRLTFLSLTSGDYLTFIDQVLNINHAEYMQGDMMGGALANIVSSRLTERHNAEYCKHYKITEAALEESKLIVKEYRLSFVNDLGQICAFVYTCTNAAPNGHWMISFIQNATAPQQDRIVQIISNLDPTSCGMKLKETRAHVKPLALDDFPAYLRTSLGSEKFYQLLGFNSKETSLIDANGIANFDLLDLPKEQLVARLGREISSDDEEKAQKKIDTRKEKSLFFLDDQPDSLALVDFLTKRNLFSAKKIYGVVDTDGTFFTLHINDQTRTLLYGNTPLAVCAFEDDHWKVTHVFTENFANCRYSQQLPTKEDVDGYVGELCELLPKSTHDEITEFVKQFFEGKGFQGLHLVYITREITKTLLNKLCSNALASGQSSTEDRDTQSPRDIEEMAASGAILSPQISSDSAAESSEGDDKEDAHHDAKKLPLTSSISFFSRKPTRIFAGITGATVAATGGTGLALEFILPSALAFIHLGPIAILAISAVLIALGLAAMGFGITKGVQAYRQAHAAAAA